MSQITAAQMTNLLRTYHPLNIISIVQVPYLFQHDLTQLENTQDSLICISNSALTGCIEEFLKAENFF